MGISRRDRSASMFRVGPASPILYCCAEEDLHRGHRGETGAPLRLEPGLLRLSYTAVLRRICTGDIAERPECLHVSGLLARLSGCCAGLGKWPLW